jgi:hypothetical protein
MRCDFNDKFWVAPFDDGVSTELLELLLRVQKRVKVLLPVINGVHEVVKILSFNAIIVHPEFHLDLDVDPTVVGEEHHVGQRVKVVVHAEVHVVVQSVVGPLVVSVAWLKEFYEAAELFLIEESISQLVVRNERVVVDIVYSTDICRNFALVKVMHIIDILILVEPASVVDQNLTLFQS